MAYEPRPLNDVFWFFQIHDLSVTGRWPTALPETDPVYVIKALGCTDGAIDADTDFTGKNDGTSSANLDWTIPTAGSGEGVVTEYDFPAMDLEDQTMRAATRIGYYIAGTATAGSGMCCIVLRRAGGAGV